MANVAAGIITNGLGGSATNMILGSFHLGKFKIEIIGSPPIEPPIEPPIRNDGGGGGPHYVWPDRTENWDDDIPRTFTIRITHNDEVTERMYVVSSKKAKFVIAVGKFITRTQELISISISNVKSKIAVVSITNVKSKFAEVTAKFKGDKD